MIRLDAVGYAIKEAGTSCFMTPQTFAFIDTFAALARSVGLEVLVEVHSYCRKQIEIAATDLGATVYVPQQQHAIRALNVTMPVLGGMTVLLTIVAAVLARDDQTRLILLVVAVVCFAAAGLTP